MPSDESIVCDPHEFIPERVELSLDELGIDVIEAEWGDSEHELFLIKQERGEIPGDRHPPNRTVNLKLRVRKEGAIPLAKAAQKLQMKVGRWQDEGGFVKRVPDSTGGFSTPVVFIVYTATLGGLHGWLMAHRQTAPEITMSLTVGPYCYGTKEETTAKVSTVNGRDLIYTVPNYLGTAPGLRRIIVTNDNATRDWRSLIAAWESRDFQEGETNKLAYEAEELTPLAPAYILVRTGASGPAEKAVRLEQMSNIWVAMLDSKITGVGHMTHVGPRRIVARVLTNNSEEQTEVRLEWRALGSTKWTVNTAVKVQGTENFFNLVDFGTARPETKTLGEQRWEWRITARSTGPPANKLVEIDRVWILPTEQYMVVQETPTLTTPALFVTRDGFRQAAGVLNGKALEDGSGNWVTSGPAGDYETQGETIGRAKRATKEEATARFATPPKGPFKNWAIRASFKLGALPSSLSPQILRIRLGVEGQGFLEAKYSVGSPLAIVSTLSMGGKTITYPWQAGVEYTLWLLNISGVAKMAWVTTSTSAVLGEPLIVQSINENEGSPTLSEMNPTPDAIVREYDNFATWEPDPTLIAYAKRQIELRSDGVFRQDSAEDIWGRLTPDGFLPYAPPSGLEERKCRGVLIPSFGDLRSLSDGWVSSSNNEKQNLSVQEKYFPGYHFASEAA